MTHWLKWHIDVDHAEAANPPQPLFSPSCFISSPLSTPPSPHPSLRFMWPPCLSPGECPCPLPVYFIKPVRDEVKSWHQHSRLVSIFRSHFTPQASGGMDGVTWSLMKYTRLTAFYRPLGHWRFLSTSLTAWWFKHIDSVTVGGTDSIFPNILFNRISVTGGRRGIKNVLWSLVMWLIISN